MAKNLSPQPTPASQRGNQNAQARQSALTAIDNTLRGQNVSSMTPVQQRQLLLALCQLIGLADKDGVIL